MALLQRVGLLPAIFFSAADDVPSIYNEVKKDSVDIGEELGKATIKCAQIIVGAVGGPIGGKLASFFLVATTDQLFKDMNMDMKQLLSQIKQAVRDELSDVELDKIQSSVDGLQRYVRTTLPGRTERWSKEDTYEEFSKEIDNLRTHIDLLMNSRFKESCKALALFVVAGSLHLATLQDLAQLDHRVGKNWRDSAHISEAKNRALEYAKHAIASNETIMKERVAKVTVTRNIPSFIPGMLTVSSAGELTGKTYRWEDETTGQYGGWFPEEGIGLDKRVEAVKERLHTDLGKPVDVATKWRAMATA